jgi:anti-sigma factor RsiW
MAKLPPLSEKDREDLVAYLDGELDSESTRALEVRLNLDAAARAEAEALRRAWDMLDYLPKPEPSGSFTSQTLEKVGLTCPVTVPTKTLPFSNWHSWSFRLGWVAATLLAGTVGYAGVSWMAKRHAAVPSPTANSAAPSPASDYEALLVRDLRLIEHKRLYDFVEDTHFLNLLDDPDLFGDDS